MTVPFLSAKDAALNDQAIRAAAVQAAASFASGSSQRMSKFFDNVEVFEAYIRNGTKPEDKKYESVSG
ncbi:hypothetical protein [Glycomyces sp. MUSA5-2]|uniref:hypothetical protein n=1 Tax=Glycomyces sp. MUSA5-2 TaxID=2053002 RepID=UPI0030098B7E